MLLGTAPTSFASDDELLLAPITDSLTRDATVPGTTDLTTSNQWILVGKGMEDRKTHERLALACVGRADDPSDIKARCEDVQFVYFKNEQEGQFTGPIVKLSKLDLKALQKQVKKCNHNATTTAWEIVGFSVGSWIAIGITAGTFGLTAPVFYAGLGWMGLAVAGPKAFAFISNARYAIDALSTENTTSIENQNGWNWATDPQKVNHRYFKTLKLLVDGRQPLPEKHSKKHRSFTERIDAKL